MIAGRARTTGGSGRGASSSSRGHARWRLALAVAFGCLVAAAPGAVSAKIFASQKQALGEAFPDATKIERRTFVLTRNQIDELGRALGSPVDAKVVVFHVAFAGEKLLGFAEVAVHKVRTQPEALLIVLNPDGRVRSVRIIAFHEPLDYLPTDRWYAQFAGKRRGDRMTLGREIHGVVGSTLSAQAASDAVRRFLVHWDILLRPVYGTGAAPEGSGS